MNKHGRAFLMLAAVAALGLCSVAFPAAQKQPQAEVALKNAMDKETVDGDLNGAIAQYKKIIATYSSNRAVAAKALLHMGQCYEKLGDSESRKAYERLVRDFGDQKDIAEQARTRLAALSTSSARPDNGPFSQRVWAIPRGRSLRGRLSPDGRYVAFEDTFDNVLASGIDFEKVAWVHDFVTGQDLNPRPGFMWPVAFSTTGGQIAYNSLLDKTKKTWELKVVGIDGTNLRSIATVPRGTMPAAWTPDGKRILLAQMQGGATPTLSAHIVSLVDGAILTLGSETKEAGDFTLITEKLHYNFSPDGKYVAYSNDQKKAMVSPLSGWAPVPVVDGRGKSWMPSWTPDGSSVLFLSDRSGATDVWSRRIVDGKPEGEAERIIRLDASWGPLGFAGDGSLYYQTWNEQANVYVADLDPATGKVVSKPMRFNQQLVGATAGPPRWSQDGKFLLYSRASTGKVVIHSIQTGEEREFSLPEPPGCPAGCIPIDWFPDNQSLLVSGGDRNAPLAFGKIDVQTGAGRLLFSLRDLSPGYLPGRAMLSRDGNAVFYANSAVPPAPKVTMVRHDLASGEEKEIYRNDVSNMWQPRLSQDGRQIAFVFMIPDAPRTEALLIGPQIKVLTIVSADGGEPRELVRTKLDIRLVAWTKDGRHLLVAQTDPKSGTDQLWSYPVDGGDPALTGLSMQIIGGADVHPDGRRIAFVGRTSTHEVWALRNIVPPAKKGK